MNDQDGGGIINGIELYGPQSESHQISTLLYCHGEELDDVLTFMGVTDDEWKSYKDVLEKFGNFPWNPKECQICWQCSVLDNSKLRERQQSSTLWCCV